MTPPIFNLTRQQARQLDRRAMDEYGVPGIVLMENAGREMASLLRQLGIDGTVLICAGKGNNGGDGLVIARHLDNAGVAVRVLLFANPADLVGDAAINYQIIAKAGVACEILPDLDTLVGYLAGADWIVDALFGTGLSEAVRPPFDRIIGAINASGKRILAVDIPSGLDTDTGQPLGAAVRATHTATVVAWKQGFLAQGAAEYTGRIHIMDMGAPRRCVES